MEDLHQQSDITLNTFVIGFVRLCNMIATHIRRRISLGQKSKTIFFNFNMQKKQNPCWLNMCCWSGTSSALDILPVFIDKKHVLSQRLFKRVKFQSYCVLCCKNTQQLTATCSLWTLRRILFSNQFKLIILMPEPKSMNSLYNLLKDPVLLGCVSRL